MVSCNTVSVMPISLVRRRAVVLFVTVVLCSLRVPADDAAQQAHLRPQALPPELDDSVGLDPAPPDSISDSGLNHLAFGAGCDAAAARLRFDELIEQRIAAIDRCCALTADQSSKLKLAGRGDAHRFLDRVEVLRPRMRSLKDVPAKNRKEL